MAERPFLQTKRLTLRPFRIQDAPRVQQLAGDIEIARTTLHIPHPYPDGAAEAWIRTHEPQFESGTLANFAIERSEDSALVGAIGLSVDRDHARAELGYWVGRPFWGQGYCTEAAVAMLDYGFREMSLNRIYAYHFSSNPASGRVMQKIGMKHEGRWRQHIRKWEQFMDNEFYGILRSEWESGM